MHRRGPRPPYLLILTLCLCQLHVLLRTGRTWHRTLAAKLLQTSRLLTRISGRLRNCHRRRYRIVEPVSKRRNKGRGSSTHAPVLSVVLSVIVVSYNRDEIVLETSIRLSSNPFLSDEGWRDYCTLQFFLTERVRSARAALS